MNFVILTFSFYILLLFYDTAILSTSGLSFLFNIFNNTIVIYTLCFLIRRNNTGTREIGQLSYQTIGGNRKTESIQMLHSDIIKLSF